MPLKSPIFGTGIKERFLLENSSYHNINKEDLNMENKEGTRFDPTRNVLQLVEAAVKRLDDIQILQMNRLNEKLDAHIEYERQLSKAEKGRINAIRDMDSKAIEVASAQARESAGVLAKQLTTSINGLRELIESVQTSLVSQRNLLVAQLSERISALEKNQYQAQGKNEISKTVLAFVSALIGSIVTIAAKYFITN